VIKGHHGLFEDARVAHPNDLKRPILLSRLDRLQPAPGLIKLFTYMRPRPLIYRQSDERRSDLIYPLLRLPSS
jgi:hypothetical protein